MLHMIESTPRTCFEPKGIACMGGCNFLIIPGQKIWPDDLCDLCHDHHEEPTMSKREDFRVTYLRETMRAATAAHRAREGMRRAVMAGIALGAAGSALLAIAGLS